MLSKVQWHYPTEEEREHKIASKITFAYVKASVKHMTWHSRGDYMATVAPQATATAVLFHRITKRQTQAPFKKNKGTFVISGTSRRYTVWPVVKAIY
mmetsp:Transcript_24390/g.27123  ORF Transcript_24390/g.27123 Transcript_24390/m.27123 type:complete len:97 (+) Transcript_24390:527-817(+)